MDSYLLRSFVVIARNGHLGRSAIELHLCKPALSNHLKELEQTLEQVLFERSGTGMRLTPAGSRLLPIAQKALDAVDEVTTVAHQIGMRVTGRADIGMVGDAIWLRAPQALTLLQRHHPELMVHLHQGVSGNVQRDVLEGRLAAGWVLGPGDYAGLTSWLLTRVGMRIVGPLAWAQQLASASVRELADFPWVDTPATCAHAQHREALFARGGRQPVGHFHADSERAHYGIAAEGLALSFLREEVALAGQQDG
ncbi:MAG: LysR family transcriptional regulator, partial [Planctomycetes bacterium]|nr:LysR family transcriptional regulator [Planctomycetota bacterium]